MGLLSPKNSGPDRLRDPRSPSIVNPDSPHPMAHRKCVIAVILLGKTKFQPKMEEEEKQIDHRALSFPRSSCLLAVLCLCVCLNLGERKMGLLDKLWDDVVAGPQPDRGLGRLRKDPPNLKYTENIDETTTTINDRRWSGEFQRNQEEMRRVTQTISIVKPPPLQMQTDPSFRDDAAGSLPSTPGAASTPTTIFTTSGFGIERDRLIPKAVSAPTSPALGSPGARDKENVWTSVFHPGSSKAMKKIGSDKFDKATSNSPTVYDWVVLSALDR